jgi:hypothetical protein
MSDFALAPNRIDLERWSQLPVVEQMGNIGSEVGRTLKARRQGRDFWPPLVRALDLFEATAGCLVQNHSHRTKEILRAKDQFLQAVFVKDDPGIEKYFTWFGIAARLRREQKETFITRDEKSVSGEY